MSVLPPCHVVIPAAGIGRRMGADRPKQYLPLAGRTVIECTLDLFLEHPAVRGLVVALSEGDSYWPSLECASDARIMCVAGGRERAESVRNALSRLAGTGDAEDWVLVHDAARPCLRRADLDRLLLALRDHPVGGILAAPASDTMKRVNDAGEIVQTVDRSRLWHAQTPQMFRVGPLLNHLERALTADFPVTDEASAFEYAGLKPCVVEGHADNIKITRPEDLAHAEWLLGRL